MALLRALTDHPSQSHLRDAVGETESRCPLAALPANNFILRGFCVHEREVLPALRLHYRTMGVPGATRRAHR